MSKAKILVVEDEGIVAKDIQSRLKRLGYDVPATAASGEEAIKQADLIRPDVVLMDIMIQGDMDGIETAGKIVERLHIPIIYVTAYSDDNTLKRARMTGPFGYLLKPFAERELYTTIEMALYKHSVDQKLKENERWLATILKSICDAVIATDMNGNITFMNAVAEALTGWKHEDALGKNVNEVFVVVNEDDRTPIETPVDTVIRENTSVDLSNHTILITKDKREIYIDNNAAPIRNEDGNITNIVLTFRDVTERKKAQKALRQQNNLYEGLLNAGSEMGEGIALIDGEKIKYANKAYGELCGYTTDELLALPSYFALVPPEEMPAYKERFRMRQNGLPVPSHFESMILTRGNKRVNVEYATHELYDNKNQFVVIMRDITVRKQAEEALRDSETRYRALFEDNPMSMWVFDTKTLKFLAVNDTAVKHYGYSREEFLSMSIKDIRPDDEVAKATDSALQKHSGTTQSGPWKHLKKDGTIINASVATHELTFAGQEAKLALVIDETERLRAENRLKKSETQYQNLINSLPVIVYSISENGNLGYLNPAFERMIGWPVSAWLEKPFVEIIHPDDVALSVEMFHRVLKGESPPPYQLRILSQSGEYRIGEFRSQPQIENGKIIGKFGVVRDVTDERKALEALIQSEEHLQKTQLRLSTLLHNLPNVILYESGGGREFISDNIFGMIGYTVDELTEDRTSFLKLVHPDDLKTILEKMKQWHLDGEPGVLSYQFRVRHKDGRYIWLEDYLVGIKPKNKPEYISGVMIDITDRKAADEEMRLQKAYFEQLFANLPEAVVVINHNDLTINNANRGFTELFQYTGEEIIGKSVEELIVPLDQVEQATELTRQAENGKTIEIEGKRRRKDGSMIDVSVLSAPIQVDNKIIAGFGIYRDITERKKAQAELLRAKEAAEESDRLKTSFISMVSHEVRTPLNTILGFTRIVKMAMAETIGEDHIGPFEEFFATIERSGDRLMKLIESFLDIASIQAGNMKLRFSDAPIERIVSHAADEMRLKIEGAGLEFIEKYHAPNVYVHLDTERFAQIVTNILGNAVKFTPKGSITIETSIIEDTAQIEIEDTGIGISKTFLPNIYIPFRQGSEGFTRGFQGAGLGLSIAQGLTEAMGGVIELISTEGKGTKVVIKFPIVEPSENIPDEIQKSTPTRSPYAQSGKGRHALVVEDNLENITYIRTVLHRGGWEVRTASSAEDALRLIDEETPDVVLMDINLLGQMNGFDALKIIQGDKRFSHLPIIAVTAYAFETERQLIMDAGFDDYLTKPFTPDQLYDVLAKHVPLLRHV